MQSIPPTTADKQTQAQKRRGSRSRKLLGAKAKSYPNISTQKQLRIFLATNVIFRAVKQHKLFIFRNVVIVIFSTKRTVPLVSVNVVKVNTINFNFPSPHSEPREVVELSSA